MCAQYRCILLLNTMRFFVQYHTPYACQLYKICLWYKGKTHESIIPLSVGLELSVFRQKPPISLALYRIVKTNVWEMTNTSARVMIILLYHVYITQWNSGRVVLLIFLKSYKHVIYNIWKCIYDYIRLILFSTRVHWFKLLKHVHVHFIIHV